MTRNLLNACKSYQQNFMHVLMLFGLGMDGMVALDHSESRN